MHPDHIHFPDSFFLKICRPKKTLPEHIVMCIDYAKICGHTFYWTIFIFYWIILFSIAPVFQPPNS